MVLVATTLATSGQLYCQASHYPACSFVLSLGCHTVTPPFLLYYDLPLKLPSFFFKRSRSRTLRFLGAVSHVHLKPRHNTFSLVESGNITRIKRRSDDLYLGLAPFDGWTPIRLLEFLTTLRDGFNALELFKAEASLLLTCYLEGSAKTLYASQRLSRVRSEARVPLVAPGPT